jgi:hypothetical protein
LTLNVGIRTDKAEAARLEFIVAASAILRDHSAFVRRVRIMSSSKFLQPHSLIPLECPRCIQCRTRMALVAIAPAALGFEQRSFACRKCGQIVDRIAVTDPTPRVIGWLSGELKPPA